MAFTALSDRQDWLPDYLIDLRAMLHDASGNYFADAELVDYINDARTHVCVDTGCLRTLQTITLPGSQSAFPIGGVYAINTPIPVPAGGTAPYVLASGAGAAGTASTASVPLSVTVTSGGSYYQPPKVMFDPGTPTVNIGATATAVLANGTGAVAVASVFATHDDGSFNANSIVPAVKFVAVGTPATLAADSSNNLQLVTYGSGQSNGVVLVDAAGVVTPLAAGAVSILDAKIASIDQVNVLWGSRRVPLRNYAYSDFNIATRQMASYMAVPTAFAIYASTLYLGPTPNASYEYELDCIMYPATLTDYQTIGEITDKSAIMAVKYYAAYRAKVSQGEEDAASAFLQLYTRETDWSGGRFTTRLSQLWPDNENLD